MPTPSDAIFAAYYPILSQTNIRRGMRGSLLDAYRLPTLQDMLAQPQPEPRSFAEQQLNTILNAQARLASVGQPIPAPEENRSALESLVNLLDFDRRLLFNALAQIPGLENERWFQALREGGGKFLEELGVENPVLRFLGGTAIDVLTSPLSYLSFGLGTVAREGAQALAREGVEQAARRFVVNLQVPFTGAARTIASAPAERVVGAVERAAAPIVDPLRPLFSRGGASARLPASMREAIRQAQQTVFETKAAQSGLTTREILEARKTLREIGAHQMDPSLHRIAFLAGEGDEEGIQALAQLRKTDPETAERVEKLSKFLRQQMDALYDAEQATGLTYRRRENYLPHLVERDQDAAEEYLRSLQTSLAQQARARTTEFAAFRLARSKSYARELEEAGFNVIYDPERIIAIRSWQSARARMNHLLAQQLRSLAKKADEADAASIVRIPARAPKGKKRPNPPKGWVPAEMLMENLIDRTKSGRVKARYFLHPELARSITTLNDALSNRREIQDLIRTAELANGLFKGIVTATPGKVFRDFIGNTFNAVIAGVPPLRFLSGFVASLRSWTPEMAEQVAVQAGGRAYRWKDLHDILWRHNLISTGETAEIAGLLRPAAEATNSLLERAAEKIRRLPPHRASAAVDTNSKLALLRDLIAQGLDPDAAARRVRRYLFDYTDITPAEKHIFRNFFWFYTFWRKELPVLFEGIFSHPELFKAGGYASREAREAAGVSEEEVPEWVRQDLGLVYRIGERFYAGSLGFPVDPLSGIESPTEGAGDFLQSVARYVGGQMTPFLRVPMELAGNTQFFSGSPIQSREGQVIPLQVGPVQRQVDPRLLYLFEQLVPVAGRSLTRTFRPQVEEVTELPPRPEQSALEQLLRGLSGMSSFASPFNPERELAVGSMLYARRLQDQITNLRRQGMYVPTTEELGLTDRPRVGEPRALEVLAALLNTQ
ncbi:hypothetical protein [Thermaerobacter subterraneus]|uniref:Large polyvalent protein associated domain-containing protein n=1 Tax=Thermaerobacter subterraneus DSM 13965 TaxID=867903 RepID=K6QD10_9FIRM|nr:hypothetical protein [Thermaerobacter subterraneus]EKP94481.1 hypothetical protein ThesuDRAFT_02218 [Thermaerobacter subterraneus DSM 13965]